MCSKRYQDVKLTRTGFENSWEEELERIKHDIKKTEDRIFMSEKCRLSEKAKIGMECEKSDCETSSSSSNHMDLCRSPLVSARKTKSAPFDPPHHDIRHFPVERLKLEEEPPKWVSPSRVPPKRDAFPFSRCPESSFDSLVSLDFGLVSPKKNWCSPPQRIERAQNREWSSPHRVIDRPNPDSSPGNWMSVTKEPCHPVLHSPQPGIKMAPAEIVLRPQEPRRMSRETYTLPEKSSPPGTKRPTRKTSVLVDYEPERVTGARKRVGASLDSAEINLLPTNDKIRRIIDSDGRVIKISLLDNFEAPAFGKVYDKTMEAAEKDTEQSKTVKSSPNLKKKVKNVVRKTPTKKKEEEKTGGGERMSFRSKAPEVKASKMEEGEGKENEVGKDMEAEREHRGIRQVITDLENILKGPKERNKEKEDEEEGETEKAVEELGKGKTKTWRTKKVFPAKVVEEKTAEVPERRKRSVDTKAMQKYIKNQKLKRQEQVKTEKKTKVAEKEARKKKLEDLRITTLRLAAQSKKKKCEAPAIKIVEPETEEDITMSLGLKQIKPKVSYRESILNLQKKNSNLKPNEGQTNIDLGKPEEEEKEEKEDERGEEEGDKTFEHVEIIQPEVKPEDKPELLKKPENTVELKTTNDLNATLKKLAETLHMKIEEREKYLRSRPMSIASKSVRDPLSQVPSRESVRSAKSVPEMGRQLMAVDFETINALKEDIKKISENFKVLHEIIVDKTDILEKAPPKKSKESVAMVEKDLPARSSREEEEKGIPDWLRTVGPRPHPYNVLTAYKHKMNVKTREDPSVPTEERSSYAEPISNKYDSDFEALSIPSNHLRSAKQSVISLKSASTSEENYYTMREDSGSELSSSILDSDKQSLASMETNKAAFYAKTVEKNNSAKSSVCSSVITEITSRSILVATSTGFESTSSRSLLSKFNTDRENLILVTPDIKLISNDLHQEKLNNCNKNNLYKSKNSFEVVEELNNSETKSIREQKSDSTITEIIDNLSEAEKLKSINEKPQNCAVQRVEEVHMRRSFFQPEMLHLQFQAELNLLETFQQSLSQFMEAERQKTLSEVNKIVAEKAIEVRKEDQAVQTIFLKESSEHSTSETEGVETEINLSEDESIKTEKIGNSVSGMSRTTSKESLVGEQTQGKELETLDFSNGHTGISFQMLNRMMKDEELRSEHQLALIRLREKTLNDKVKAELTFLEMKKRALKDRGGDEEHNVSAIKKKQRGILLKYQSEKEEIERLKKMHKIASEERKIMIKQQKQIQQMQMSTKDMIIKLKKREKSPTKRVPLKPKPLKSYDSQSSIQEDVPLAVSDSNFTESVCSVDSSRCSNPSDFGISSAEEESEVTRSAKAIETKKSKSFENIRSKKSLLEVERYPQKRHSVEELLSWTKRLEEKENRLKELEKQTMNVAQSVRNRLTKSPRSTKASMKDRSTSPFQFPDKIIFDISPVNDSTETKKSSTISEAIDTTSKAEVTEKTESFPEKIQSSASEEIPGQFSKKIATITSSRTMEYNSESFESPSSSETPKTKPEVTRSKSGTDRNHKGVAIKLSLSPRMQSPRRRYSSGSDDSLNLSHTETASEQSDLESRIAALNEQLRKRKLEAERLRREQKKAQRERLKVKEQSLLKQIQAYDSYIQKKKQELEQEYEHSTQAIMKPLIKQPKVAEKSSLKRQELLLLSDGDKDKALFYLKPPQKNKEESLVSEKINESDSEILEQIKEASESVKEQIEEEEESKEVESFVEVESSAKEASETVKSTSVSESLREQENLEGSQSESEDQSISVKTTLHTPEKPDTTTPVTEDESPSKETLEEDAYEFDSFESDFEDKISTRVSESQKQSELSEIEIPKEVGIEDQSAAREEEETEKEEERQEEEEEKESTLYDKSQESIPDTGESSKSLEEVTPQDDGRLEKADKIADSIILEFILESVKMFSSKKLEEERKSAEEAKLSLELLSSFLAKEIISEAVEDMLRIYNRKAAPEELARASPEGVTSEVRRRIKEIMSQAGGVKDQRLTQDIMVTTYDVSPPGEEASGAAEREEFLQSLSQHKEEEKPEDKIYPEGEGNDRSEAFGQEWFDDDFGLSRTRREAEELRLQQLQIEQEIQQLQAQQEQVPYFYLREIPNKPPPPYTPPGKPLAEVPASEADIVAITSAAVRILAEEMTKGRQVSDIEPPREYFGSAGSEHVQCYKLFLFDLAKHIIGNVVEEQEEKKEGEELPWTRTRERLSKHKYRRVERTSECLDAFVRGRVLGAFGFGKRAGKESLIVRWIKKKRDHVDEILVGESQEEEAQWTQYDEDQVTVKNEVTAAILDGLLEETAQVLSDIYNKKMKSAGG